MKRRFVLLLLVLILLTGCGKYKPSKSVLENKIPVDLFETEDMTYYEIVDESNIFIVNDSEAFIYDVESKEKTVVKGINSGNANEFFYINVDNERMFKNDGDTLSVYNFQGNLVATLSKAIDGVIMIDFDSILFTDRIIISSYQRDNNDNRDVYVYDYDLKEVQKLEGRMEVGINGSNINPLIFKQDFDGISGLYYHVWYYDKTTKMYVEYDQQFSGSAQVLVNDNEHMLFKGVWVKDQFSFNHTIFDYDGSNLNKVEFDGVEGVDVDLVGNYYEYMESYYVVEKTTDDSTTYEYYDINQEKLFEHSEKIDFSDQQRLNISDKLYLLNDENKYYVYDFNNKLIDTYFVDDIDFNDRDVVAFSASGLLLTNGNDALLYNGEEVKEMKVIYERFLYQLDEDYFVFNRETETLFMIEDKKLIEAIELDLISGSTYYIKDISDLYNEKDTGLTRYYDRSGEFYIEGIPSGILNEHFDLNFYNNRSRTYELVYLIDEEAYVIVMS